MSSVTLFRLSGLAAILAGLAYISDTVLDWLWPGNVWGVGLLVSLLGLHGLTGLFLRQQEEGGVLNLVGYFLNFTGLAALIGVVFANNFIVPRLDTAVAEAVFTGSTLFAFIAVGILFLVGVWTFSVALWRVGLFSRAAIGVYALGAVPVALPPVFPDTAVTVGGLLVGIGIIWLGGQLWRGV